MWEKIRDKFITMIRESVPDLGLLKSFPQNREEEFRKI